MKITVKGQQAIVTDDFLVANSVGIYECEFEFDSSWDGYAKNSVWQLNNDEPKESIISSGVAEVPWEVLVNGGFIRVGVYGTKDEKVMPTVWGEKRKVHLGTPTGSIGTEPTPSIYAQILAVATEAKDIAEDVAEDWANVYATAETLEPNESASVVFEDNTFKFGIPKGVKGDTGETGFSPTITVIDISGGHRVTITDEQGMESFDVLDGHDGQNGADGYSPTIAVSNITGGHRVVVTDKNGSHTFDVMDGQTGATGADGVGIASIAKTSSVGLVDTYTITLTNGNTSTFTVTNGQDGSSDFAEYLPIDSASGSIASFVDGAKDIPVESLKVNISPVQNLNGQSSPYPSGGGKNLASPVEGGNKNGVTCTVNSDGSAKLNGTARGNAAFYSDYFTLKAGTYKSNGVPAGGINNYVFYLDGVVGSANIGNELTITVAEDVTTRSVVQVYNGGTANNITMYPMIRLSSVTDGTFAPYSNICPISGHTQADVVVAPTSDPDDPDKVTYTIPFGETVYGGSLEVETGVLTINKTIVDLGTLNWTWNNGGWFQTVISDMKYVSVNTEIGNAIAEKYKIRKAQGMSTAPNYEFAIDTSNMKVKMPDNSEEPSGQLVYELATPQTITLTPTEVTTLLGDNNIWADCGDVAVLYRADTKAYIDGTIVDVPLAMIAPIETGTTSSKAYAVGEYFILNGTQFCKAKTSIASGATFTLNTNYTVTTIGAELKSLQ